jgi:3-dehydroquinate dehydratase
MSTNVEEELFLETHIKNLHNFEFFKNNSWVFFL